MPKKTALLVVDMLAGGFQDESLRTCNDDPVLSAVRRLLERARTAGGLVVHIVEDFDETKYLPGSRIWNAYQIHPGVAPVDGEPVVRQLRYDAFYESGLHELLSNEGVETVVVAGISSPWCVDTAVRRAFGLGYRVVLAADAHGCGPVGSLSGPEVARHTNEILAACFAEVKPVDEIAL